jgi:hypothetical protein
MTILRGAVRRSGALVCASILGLALAVGSAAARPCVGDCDGDDSVGIDELMLGVNAAQRTQALGACPSFDCDHSGSVPIHCLIEAVNSALDGCPCPLAAGAYTLTQRAGGTLQVSAFAPFPIPPDGTLTADVGAGRQPNCVHDVVVPFPGGFALPTFCIPATGFSVGIEQTGCGVGRIDSNGGADYTVKELGDTSDSSTICNLPQAGCAEGADSALRIDVTVGDGTPDTCASGTANLIVTVPVVARVWIEHSSGDSCPANDGTYDTSPNPDPLTDDLLIVKFRQVLDLTTDTASARWADLDGDGCAIAGRGPAGGFSGTGRCLDLETGTVDTVDAGPVGSSGAPLFDATYVTRAPNSIDGPAAPLRAVCASPPEINFHGTATRCLTDP